MTWNSKRKPVSIPDLASFLHTNQMAVPPPKASVRPQSPPSVPAQPGIVSAQRIEFYGTQAIEQSKSLTTSRGLKKQAPHSRSQHLPPRIHTPDTKRSISAPVPRPPSARPSSAPSRTPRCQGCGSAKEMDLFICYAYWLLQSCYCSGPRKWLAKKLSHVRSLP